MKACKVEQCEAKYHAEGYCATHYRQVRASGETRPVGKYWTMERREAKRQAMTGKRSNTGRTHFKKGSPSWNKGTVGVMPSPRKPFKKGHTPWNKGKTGVMPRPHNKIGDGITSEDKLERGRFQKTMQHVIFHKDNYTCQICDQHSGYLQVDHIKSWSEYPELRFEESNCRTLCMACHYYITFKRKLPKGVIWGHNLSRRIES